VTASYDSETDVEYISEELQKKYEKELTKEDIQKVIDNNFTG
jgi:hypothetical protein